MKLYYFMIIAVGLMWTFHLAGIQTGSSHILDKISGLNLNETDVVPEVSSSTTYTTSDIINANSWWWAIILTLSVLVAINVAGGVFVLGSGVNASALTYAITASLATYICSMFAFDFLSIVVYMNQITGGTGWEYYLTWILIFPILVGFVFSLIEFVQGKD